MKIVSWNSNWGFDLKKVETIISTYPDADILAIQECKLHEYATIKSRWNYAQWYGDLMDSNLGVAVFSQEWKFEFTNEFNRNFRYVVPFRVSREDESFLMFVVWTKSGENGMFNREQNIIKAVDYRPYKKLFNEGAVVIGDFNAWVHEPKWLKEFEKNLNPLENCAANTEDWFEKTLYSKNSGKCSVIDYCFMSPQFLDRIENLKYSVHKAWHINNDNEQTTALWEGLSDHAPICVEFDFKGE